METITHTKASDEAARRDRQHRRRRLRWVVGVCLVLFGLFTWLETKIFGLGEVDLPVSGNLLIFILLNLNVLLLLVVIFLVLRNLAELVFERRRRVLGARLRTKLVVAFVSLSMIPTGLLFLISLQFISTSMDYWFNINVEHSLEESLAVAREVYQEAQLETVREGGVIAAWLQAEQSRFAEEGALTLFLRDMLESHGLGGIELVSPERALLASVYRAELAGLRIPELPGENLRRALVGESGQVVTQTLAEGELIRSLTPIAWPGQDGMVVLALSRLLPQERLQRLERISSGLEGYRQLMMFKAPLKTSLLVTLLIVTLLIVFCAIWFGFYIAGGLTGPIRRLAEATRRVADGDLDFVIEKNSGDEIGSLVDSFNQMTRDLLTGRRQIEETTQELDRRRRYTETILQNVTAGVISLDDSGRVITINRFAEELLKVDRAQIVGRHYRAILRRRHLQILEGFLHELSQSSKHSIQLPLRLTVGDETYSLRINLTRLFDEEGRPLGVVLVFDNLSDLEKAQRMAAWREVARRIAHEVKNPLTPIQLSAQRLRKRYLAKLADEGEVFDLCTRTIINQVEELQKLVGEFSSFARMPAIHKAMANLAAMVDEVLVLYREGHKGITFTREGEVPPPFLFDPKQLKRVLINLVDNAVAVVPEKGGRISVNLTSDPERKLFLIEVKDNGPGVREEDKLRLFEPYFSTKKSGTGLGLAIAGTVVADHGGAIRVRDHEPHGACFVVELPMEFL
ncbi:MAG TPA: HAMP domain-containing protein [Desulfurivibrio alkaliphilus]|uniref:histidine kinase n=1 Tax=Desulfurivibrio alkaliphilus TaxID=427923 RepID=A0A7C2XLK0_9BACT|nr:HAMP domain-containing protein [Desulfurivibrio alkaliphilus]